ncbi:proline dehydrogenase [Trichonephila inaurata madagascariensis]|uniref:Proline dehydrogenase n=1 Tax=Trichonephila inaurata madagascariensis TaxID=2747483 RepID=A0A8X7CGK8_9ARAC|nr:proline dehydrogenase [Trichonephila inaurata madagascariensis]
MGKRKKRSKLCEFRPVIWNGDRSYPLAERGFAVYKSVPYGSLVEVLPYLARRALENKGVLDGARKEHALLVKELRTRLLPRPFGVNIP